MSQTVLIALITSAQAVAKLCRLCFEVTAVTSKCVTGCTCLAQGPAKSPESCRAHRGAGLSWEISAGLGGLTCGGRIAPSKVLSRKHLVFSLHESGCHLSLPAAIANLNGCSPSQGVVEPEGKGRHPQWCHCCPEGSLRAANPQSTRRPPALLPCCTLNPPPCVCAAMKRFLDTLLLITAVPES